MVWKNIIHQYINGNDAIMGLMLESNLYEGNQKFSGDLSNLKYGVSITDECISWESTQQLLLDADKKIRQYNHQTFLYNNPIPKTIDKFQEPLW